MKRILGLWFGMTQAVDRRTYVVHGLVLMAVKYAVDSLLASVATGGRFLDPIEYLNPSLSERWQSLMGSDYSFAGGADWFVVISLLWALPFIWIGITMSARRARDAAWSQWLSLLFFVPFINLLLILILSLAPSRVRTDAQETDGLAADQGTRHLFKSAVKAVGMTGLFGFCLVVLAVFGLGDYTMAIFLGGPFVMGALSSWLVNRDGYRGWKSGVGVSVLSIALCAGLLIISALEGVICLVTAAPLCLVLAVIGALVGNVIVKSGSSPHTSFGAMALAMPFLTFGAVGAPPEVLPIHAVVSTIDIDVAPSRVWPNVIGFSELPPPANWLMKTGIAVPLKARIEGEGVGAIRYCEFTTGPFVEPITVWEPPHKLAFDVIKAPPSMEEWSPYQLVHAPHLTGNMVSRRGQFELQALPNGGTRLIGTTWYTIDMAPDLYWKSWADFAVHGIHDRVLRHIKELSEGEKTLNGLTEA